MCSKSARVPGWLERQCRDKHPRLKLRSRSHPAGAHSGPLQAGLGPVQGAENRQSDGVARRSSTEVCSSSDSDRLIANTERGAGELRVEGGYRFGEVRGVDMILTVSSQSPRTGKGNEGWKLADGPTPSPRLGMIINPAPLGATIRSWETTADAMPCEPVVDGGGLG
mmetsp:Transcript_37886/g.100914  ORF Transcript_37886/g.100914 Transcript_37886/m.100914 type:complete len:167 (-) Transcript_37886:3777-4277(-)